MRQRSRRKVKGGGRYSRQRRRKRTREQKAAPWPELQPEDRVSSVVDLSQMPEYKEFAAEVGEEQFLEVMDYFFYFIGNSLELLEEPEFQGFQLPIEPYDFLVFEAYDYLMETVIDGKQSIWQEDGFLDEPYGHIVTFGLRRYLIPEVRRELRRRVARIAARARESRTRAMANAVEIALDDVQIWPMMISMLEKLCSDTLIDRVLDMAEQFQRDWEGRDRSLDRWADEIRQASFDQPADEAVRQLVQAEEAALPVLTHMYYDEEYEWGDYPLLAAVEALGQIPSQLSLSILVQTLIEDGDSAAEVAFESLSNMRDLACEYFHYALTRPEPKWEVELYGYHFLGEARCEEAFELLQRGLQRDEAIAQISAWEGLLALGDRRAIPVLRDFLRSDKANEDAKDELLYMLQEHEGGHPWAGEILRG